MGANAFHKFSPHKHFKIYAVDLNPVSATKHSLLRVDTGSIAQCLQYLLHKGLLIPKRRHVAPASFDLTPNMTHPSGLSISFCLLQAVDEIH